MEQQIITAENGYIELDSWIKNNSVEKLMVVCDDSIKFQKKLGSHIEGLSELK